MAKKSGTVYIYNSIQEDPAIYGRDELKTGMSSSFRGNLAPLEREGRHKDKLVSDSPSAKVEEKLTPKNGLDDLVKKSHYVIFQTHSIFPFDLYPNGITICIDKVIFCV